jgi:hypothetical protein
MRGGRNIREEVIDQNRPWAFFDGASQNNNSCLGGGGGGGEINFISIS